MVPAKRSTVAPALPRYGTLQQLDARRSRKHFAEQVRNSANPRRSVGQGLVVFLGIGDQLAKRARPNGWMRHQRHRLFDHHADAGQVAERVVGQGGLQRGIDQERRGGEKQGVAVCGRSRNRIGPDCGCRAGAVFNDDG
jgi:hypothetical protein